MHCTEVHLKHYPQGQPQLTDFNLINRELPTLKVGEVLIKNHWMSVDPYMRVRMQVKKGYLPPFELNQALEGHAIGEVIESQHDQLPAGTFVKHFAGWRDYCVMNHNAVEAFEPQSQLSHYLGVLGMPGMTAYIGLFNYGLPKPGETLFVSAASGAVGSMVCQLAQQHGCNIIASAGREDKIAWLKNNVGIEQVINYKKQSVSDTLPTLAPNGIDIYFDNVGGDHLITAYNLMNPFGRIVMCGMISQYNRANPTLSLDLFPVVSKRLSISGFILSDHMSQQKEFESHVLNMIKHDQLKIEQAHTDGIDTAPQTFIGLLNGTFLGKVLVKI